MVLVHSVPPLQCVDYTESDGIQINVSYSKLLFIQKVVFVRIFGLPSSYFS